MTDQVNNNTIIDFINNNRIEVSLQINNEESIKLRIRIPTIKEEDEEENACCECNLMKSPAHKRRKIDNEEFLKNAKNTPLFIPILVIMVSVSIGICLSFMHDQGDTLTDAFAALSMLSIMIGMTAVLAL